MASSCINCCIFHIISIPLNCRSDTAWRVTQATAVASMRRTEALASVKFYQILSIFIFFIRLIILEDFIRLISYNGPCVRLGCSFFLATALQTMIGPKVNIFYVSPCLLCFSNLAPELASSGYLTFSHLGNRGLKFLIWTHGEINPGNRAHVKRPLIPYTFYLSFYLGKVWKPYIQESQLKSMIRCRVQTCSKEVLLILFMSCNNKSCIEWYCQGWPCYCCAKMSPRHNNRIRQGLIQR